GLETDRPHRDEVPAAADFADPIETGAVRVGHPAAIEANLGAQKSGVSVAEADVAADRSARLRTHSAGQEREHQQDASSHGSCTSHKSADATPIARVSATT